MGMGLEDSIVCHAKYFSAAGGDAPESFQRLLKRPFAYMYAVTPAAEFDFLFNH